MKDWPVDLPRAKLIARKRKAILAAAKEAFLETGYDGTTMESIGKRAGVSPMTIYRHAANKDDLFAAVIESACEPSNEEDRGKLEAMMELPIAELLLQSAIHMQETLMRPDTLALMRVVITETTRFPHLAELAYKGLILRIEGVTAWILGERIEASALSLDDRIALGHSFVDRLIGADLMRALMGLPPPSVMQMRERGELARDDLMRSLKALQPTS